MDINFRVTHIYENPLDPRCAAYPGVDCRIVRLSPVEDVHVAAAGDIVVVLPKADADGLKAETPAVTVPDPRDQSKTVEVEAAVAGTKAVLTIG